MEDPPQSTANASHFMQCMEVWGGNRAIDNGVVMPGLDAWIYSRPFAGEGGGGRSPGVENASSVEGLGGGDIHYVTSCATGRITRLMIADVSGHGAPVAEAAVALRKLMRRFSNYIDQTKFVESVNERFGELSTESQRGDFGAMFATAVVATYFAPTDELTISLAGHPRPIRYDARSKRWTVLTPPDRGDGRSRAPSESSGPRGPSNLPLGILEGTQFSSETLLLGREDLVLFYTDALIEAKTADGRQLGEAGLAALLGTLSVGSPQELVPALLAAIARWSGTTGDSAAAFDDDVTALLIRRNQLKPKASLISGIKSAIVIGRYAIRSMLPGGMPLSLPPLSFESLGGAFFAKLNRRARSASEE